MFWTNNSICLDPAPLSNLSNTPLPIFTHPRYFWRKCFELLRILKNCLAFQIILRQFLADVLPQTTTDDFESWAIIFPFFFRAALTFRWCFYQTPYSPPLCSVLRPPNSAPLAIKSLLQKLLKTNSNPWAQNQKAKLLGLRLMWFALSSKIHCITSKASLSVCLFFSVSSRLYFFFSF